ncbi:OmpA family protein [Amorphus orientalis]|uniref:Outer membrane protein OmpA-like peptidoglycan-associated protein n=1 Tax=Amorphus orientalis TaxID=649198 RepID=A0AAE4AT11_9HYPH|nr:OmpA family protein [Amorphus orientalis]MDQ0315672.1 outer membrane protein OmpA-like peptidoglycan-associated protein [Amorphus orientalis]
MKRTILLAAALAFLAVPASAQTQLSRNEIINNLQSVENTRVQITAEELRQQALDNIRNNPGDNSTTDLPAEAQLAKLRQFIVEITFDFDSDRIKPDSYYTLGLIADALHTPYLYGNRFLVIGHTDAKGKREYNLELSQRRANAVANALSTTFFVPPEMLAPVGLGEEDLRDPSDPYAAVNRRVQLINLGPIQQ